MTAFFESNRFRRPSQMRDRWYVPGLILCLVIASLSIFLSLRMQVVPSSVMGDYVRWKLLLGDGIFLPVLMIALGRYRLGRQFERRESSLYDVEVGLRQKTHGLEQTIRERTAELREEIEERHRADLLNRGRNRVLEMLAKNESLQATVNVLVATVTEQRTVWCAALHQLEGDALLLRGSVGVPEMLMDHLQRIKADFPDAPEAVALQMGQAYTIEDTTQQRTPWRQLLAANGIGLEGLQNDESFQTIVKTRIIARQQQVVRVDRERPQPLSEEAQAWFVEKVRELLPRLDAVIFEDYGKGFLQQKFVDNVTSLARGAGKLITADPNPHNRLVWRGITAVKPNRSEAFAAANQPWHEPEPDPLRDRQLLRVGAELLRTWKPDHLLVTLGEQGMILFDQGNPPFHVPSRAREVYDLSGAGDTAIGLFTLALASGASAIEAAEISNHASSVVVGKLGTATLTPTELLESFYQRDE